MSTRIPNYMNSTASSRARRAASSKPIAAKPAQATAGQSQPGKRGAAVAILSKPATRSQANCLEKRHSRIIEKSQANAPKPKLNPEVSAPKLTGTRSVPLAKVGPQKAAHGAVIRPRSQPTTKNSPAGAVMDQTQNGRQVGEAVIGMCDKIITLPASMDPARGPIDRAGSPVTRPTIISSSPPARMTVAELRKALQGIVTPPTSVSSGSSSPELTPISTNKLDHCTSIEAGGHAHFTDRLRGRSSGLPYQIIQQPDGTTTMKVAMVKSLDMGNLTDFWNHPIDPDQLRTLRMHCQSLMTALFDKGKDRAPTLAQSGTLSIPADSESLHLVRYMDFLDEHMAKYNMDCSPLSVHDHGHHDLDWSSWVNLSGPDIQVPYPVAYTCSAAELTGSLSFDDPLIHYDPIVQAMEKYGLSRDTMVQLIESTLIRTGLRYVFNPDYLTLPIPADFCFYFSFHIFRRDLCEAFGFLNFVYSSLRTRRIICRHKKSSPY
ncbi:hypothetical protein H4R33_003937 [Dimargaris cristalligena]|uniref:Uncharacterized protein n=1 Tax=Dimargaris cristalligena TaxID=215637 RepID=A0A4P9ZNK8_9FUNG|nr:hypothetical protein H4R33_003937 [Dimargaris cristalligena]RKP34765.1 hypothetical protein BJ085DRAFT_40775 [Dimargaris cristalligena]|eukprot:RKP34765.1 hypothetical protein BJ085DRAFT_40775 [Dimargaris cristalligena]